MSVLVWTGACATSNPSVFSDEPDGGGAGSDAATRSSSSSGSSSGGGTPGSSAPPSDDGGGMLVVSDATTGQSFIQCTSQGQCVNHACSGGGHTSITGTVFDPAQKNPLANVAVYVPQNAPSALPQGAACNSCDALYTGGVLAGALTDASGKFTIQDVPSGKGVPLVVQIGKWRRIYNVDVADCQSNSQPTLRLPRNGGEGDIPEIAISTGGADTMECLFHRIGVDEAEYTPGAGGNGHIHIFQGGTGAMAGGAGGGFGGGFGGAPTPGATMTAATPASASALWPNVGALMPYDIVVLSCEGGETANPVPQALNDYASMGGRVFASHFHYSWFIQPPFSGYNLATWTPGANSIGNINAIIETTLPNGAPFPKGTVMQQWLSNVGALTNGELPIQVSRHNADVAAANTPSTPWIVADPAASAPGAAQYFSWDMPVAANSEMACGRIVYSDLHVGAVAGDYGQKANDITIPRGSIVPTGCASNALSPQEQALEFMIFDLSACLMPVGEMPMPPTPMAQ